MGNDYGTLTKESLTTYSWDLGNNKLLNGIFYTSNFFSVFRKDCTFRFQIQKVSVNKYKLFLRILPNGDWKLDLHIILEYKTGKKAFSLKSVINLEWDHLATIQVKDLMKITCTFLKVDRFMKPSIDTNMQVTKIVPATVSTGKRKVEEGSSYIQERKKPRSSDELGENFENAFLDEEESDVTFKVGDKEYPAHKIITKVRSPVFNAMLKHDMKEKIEGVINIADCDPLIFRDFLFYIYTGKLDRVSEENVFELYHLSDKYDVKNLKKECLYFMHNSLSVDMICDVLSLATTHYEHDLLSRATQFFLDHAQDILESEMANICGGTSNGS